MNEDFLAALRNLKAIARDIIRSGEYSDASAWQLINTIEEVERRYTNENKSNA